MDNGNHSGTVDEKANFFIKYRWTAATAQTLKEKLVKLQADEDRIVQTVL